VHDNGQSAQHEYKEISDKLLLDVQNLAGKGRHSSLRAMNFEVTVPEEKLLKAFKTRRKDSNNRAHFTARSQTFHGEPIAVIYY
jgi:hypothetical protein